MLVLLPPSEGKASSGRGAPLKLETLSLPGLTEARAAILEELVELCVGDEEKAREVLGLSEGLRGEIAKNTELRTAGPGRPGRSTQACSTTPSTWLPWTRPRSVPGVLCSCSRGCGGGPGDGPDSVVPLLDGGEAAGARSAGRALACADGLRAHRGRGDGLVLDLRSSAYAAAWKPKGEVAGRTATVRVLHAPTRKVVSHFNKATKGRMVRSLLSAGIAPKDPAELVEALRELGYEVEAEAPAKAGAGWSLDVLVDEVH